MRRRPILMSCLALPAAAFAGGQPPTTSSVVPRALVFPSDFGAHPETQIEWWYVTGALAADGGGDYGFQITFFRSRTEVPSDHPSRFAASQIVFAHAAVTDLAGRRLRHDQRVARAGFGIAEAAAGDTSVRLRDWSIQRSGGTGSSAYVARAASEAANFGFDLRLLATQAVLPQGEAGYSRKGPAPSQASLYYSEPQLQVSGSLMLEGRSRSVRGRAWLDHEWSDSVLGHDAVGWDWIGINLDDGGALTAFQLRRADGSTLWAGGSHRPAGGSIRNFAADEVRFTPGRRWQSPSSQAVYPVEWEVHSPAGHHRVRARLDAQELDSRGSTGAIYWEGLSTLERVDGGPPTVIGNGYLEMTGYASKLAMN